MASTTTAQYADVTIEAELGTTTVDLSGSSNQLSIALEMVIGEAAVFNDPWPVRVMMAKNATIDLTALFTTAANEARDYFEDWYNESFTDCGPHYLDLHATEGRRRDKNQRRLGVQWDEHQGGSSSNQPNSNHHPAPEDTARESVIASFVQHNAG